MTYDQTYIDAYLLQEVEPGLFKVLDPGPCISCHLLTFFLDYTTGRPRFICSGRCFTKTTRLGPKKGLIDQPHVQNERDLDHGTSSKQ